MDRVDIHLIDAIVRIRKMNEAHVSALADSIADVGLLNPVTVYRQQVIRSGASVDGYGLIAGLHRLEACKRLGLADIAVQIVELDELHRTIAECDENLCGTNLTPSERAEFTHRRKVAYEALHPETANGSTGNGRPKLRQPGEATSDNETNRFTKETAALTGTSERSVQRDAERGERVSNSAMALIKGTHLDTGAYLDKLKILHPAAQIKRVKTDLAAPKRQIVRLVENRISPLMREWNAASEHERNELRALIIAERRVSA